MKTTSRLQARIVIFNIQIPLTKGFMASLSLVGTNVSKIFFLKS